MTQQTQNNVVAGLYLHVPFCRKKCSYCDFFSAPPCGTQLETWHLALIRNLHLLDQNSTEPLESVYFGGGTPSLLSPQQIDAVVSTCRHLFPLAVDAEITLEANPADLTRDRLEGYLAAGINRLSLGIQSFCDQRLQQLGRRHSAEQAIRSCQLAREAGFNNLSIDLIFALPGQTVSHLKSEIQQLLALAPEHISIYGLSVEEGTVLEEQVKEGIFHLPSEEAYADAYLYLSEHLQACDYEHYEISNFARRGYRSRHNQGYWRRTTCLAAGCGAHGFDASGYGYRTFVPQDFDRYQQKLARGENPAEVLERFSREQAIAETLYLALRTCDGLNCVEFARRFGQRPEEAYPEARAQLSPYLTANSDRWYIAPQGWLLYDYLIRHFLTTS